MFVLQVPLVNSKEYVLFHNIALPTPHNIKEPNLFSLIIPTNKYIAMTKDKAHYCILNDLKQCKVINAGTYICEIENVYSTEVKSTCESELLAKVNTQKPIQCETKTLSGKLDIWKPLINNNWIYIQSEPNRLSIDCLNSKLYEITVLGTGIVNIPNECIGYCKSTTLIPRSNILNITSSINYMSDFSLINDTCCKGQLNDNVDDVSLIHLNDVDLDDFNTKYNIKMQSILKDIKSFESYPHIVRYGTHYSIVVILILTLISLYIIYVIIKKFKFCKSGSNQPYKI